MGSILLALLLVPPQDGPPALRVEGTKLLAKDGQEVRLRGVSIADPHPLGAEFKRDHFELLARGWRANCIRIPVHPGTWKSKGAAAYDKLLDDAIGWCREFGLWTIVDYHGIGNPRTGKAQKDKPEYDSSMDLARQFWRHVAGRYGNRPGVLYEVFNEPMQITWAELKPLAAELVSIVREGAPDSVVIVPSPDYSYDLRGAAADPLEAKNLLYSWHAYPVRGTSWDPYLAEARKKLAIFATEWGFDLNGDAVTTGSTDGFGLPLLNMMDASGIHWTAWCWHPQWGPPMLAGWDATVTPFGRLVRSWLAGDRPKRRVTLQEANDLTIWLEKPDLKSIGESKFDAVILDQAPDGKEIPKNDLEFLKWSSGGSKLVIAYLSIGEAEEGRPYWKGLPPNPDWLGPANPDRRTRSRVRFWDEKWQKIAFDALDRLMAQGCDGVLLDAVEAWAFWEAKDKDPKAKPRMIEFVSQLSTRAKRRNRSFAVLVRNAEDLLENPNYLASIDGVVREEIYFPRGRVPLPLALHRSQELLDRAVAAGKKAVVVEYSKEPGNVDFLFERAKVKKYVPVVAVRELDRLVVPPGHEPD
jgi:uncharacterized protein (TIGR01370 family)